MAQIFAGALLFSIGLSACAVLASSTTHLIYLIIPLFASLSLIPIIGANSVALAMEATGKHADSGSSVIGLLQFSIAAIASGMVSQFHNGTAYPMTSLIFAVSILAAVTYFVGRRMGFKEN